MHYFKDPQNNVLYFQYARIPFDLESIEKGTKMKNVKVHPALWNLDVFGLLLLD